MNKAAASVGMRAAICLNLLFEVRMLLLVLLLLLACSQCSSCTRQEGSTTERPDCWSNR
jgi:hypothetical protein